MELDELEGTTQLELDELEGTTQAFASPAAATVWEVDDASGVCVYRGRDLELAHELYVTAEPGAHLFRPVVR